MTRPIWITVGAFVGVLLLAGMIHLAFRSAAQLYLNLKATSDKQTEHIFEVERKVTEMERKLSIFEQHIKYEAESKERKP